jgi:5-methylcytosine-specific restriction endonuclease McrA
MREILRLNQQEYYKNNSEIQKQASNNWKNKNKQKQKEYWKKWYLNNREKRRKYFFQYQKDNPNIIMEKSRRRRIVKLNAIGSFTEIEFLEKLKEYNYKCYWCGKKMNKKEITRDHYIPLTKGGTDYIDNIVPCCCSCNCIKKDRMPDEYLKIIGNHEPSQGN